MTSKKPIIFAVIVFTLMITGIILVISLRNRPAPYVPKYYNTTSSGSTTQNKQPAGSPANSDIPAGNDQPQQNSDVPQMVATFNVRYGYPLLGSSTCDNVRSNDYMSELSDLDDAAGYLPEQESLMDYFAEVMNSCFDGKLDIAEYARVLNLHAQVGNHEGNLLKWQLINSFVAEFDAYIAPYLGSDTVVPDCKTVTSITADAFVTQIHAIESRHGAPQAGDDLRATLIAKQTECAPAATNP